MELLIIMGSLVLVVSRKRLFHWTSLQTPVLYISLVVAGKSSKNRQKNNKSIYFSDSAHENVAVPLTFANKEWSLLTRSWNSLH